MDQSIRRRWWKRHLRKYAMCATDPQPALQPAERSQRGRLPSRRQWQRRIYSVPYLQNVPPRFRFRGSMLSSWRMTSSTSHPTIASHTGRTRHRSDQPNPADPGSAPDRRDAATHPLDAPRARRATDRARYRRAQGCVCHQPLKRRFEPRPARAPDACSTATVGSARALELAPLAPR